MSEKLLKVMGYLYVISIQNGSVVAGLCCQKLQIESERHMMALVGKALIVDQI